MSRSQNTKTQEPQKQEAQTSNREQLLKAVAVQQKIAKAQSYAKELREKAATVRDPKERERLIKDAYEKEIEAHGNSKLARRMQSGTWQGLAAGSGIGLGTGLGIGTVVGTLVGGLVSIPTTGLGALIGTGVGAISGPFIKIGGIDKRWEEASPEEVVDAIEKEQAGKPEPAEQNAGDTESLPHATLTNPTSRRKPRKIQIRSEQMQMSAAEGGSPAAKTTMSPVMESASLGMDASNNGNDHPRRPRKLEVRSQSHIGSPRSNQTNRGSDISELALSTAVSSKSERAEDV